MRVLSTRSARDLERAAFSALSRALFRLDAEGSERRRRGPRGGHDRSGTQGGERSGRQRRVQGSRRGHLLDRARHRARGVLARRRARHGRMSRGTGCGIRVGRRMVIAAGPEWDGRAGAMRGTRRFGVGRDAMDCRAAQGDRRGRPGRRSCRHGMSADPRRPHAVARRRRRAQSGAHGTSRHLRCDEQQDRDPAHLTPSRRPGNHQLPIICARRGSHARDRRPTRHHSFGGLRRPRPPE